MAGTRVKRARDGQLPGAEELRFDFAGGGDAVGDEATAAVPPDDEPARDGARAPVFAAAARDIVPAPAIHLPRPKR